MSNESAGKEGRRRKWTIITAVVLAAIAIGFYIGAFFIGHYLYNGAQ